MTTIAKQLKIKDFPFEIKDSKGNIIYYEDSDGFWAKSEFDSNGNEIYYENSHGTIVDTRPNIELTLEQIAEKFDISVNQLRIKYEC